MDHHEGSRRQIARRFRVSLSFVVRLLQRRRDADPLEPKPHGGGPPPVLGPDDQQRRAELIREQPDATVEQLKQRGSFPCTLKTLWLALRQRGLTFKEKSLHASGQDRPDVQKERRAFRSEVGQIEPGRLGFVDETGLTTAMTPAYAWSPRGERAVAAAPGSWESVTVIAALGLDGVRAPLAFPRSVDTAAFQSYVDQVPVPELHKGDVVVFDNLKPHLASGVAAAIARAGAQVLPLPPSSPDYTPMEEMYSKVKTFLRRIAARTKGDLYDAIGEALKQVTPEDIIGWFKEAGLCATHG
ncbi:MAG TPA: IS630 family transposase [Isosphaeraceae bacterium]|nr:IS630 family transposase [Isosphaeraceae bacterium]